MGVETALIVGTALSAAGTLYSGYQQYESGKYQQAQANADAQAAQGAARVEAERIRQQTQKQQSAARAALAGSGVKVNEGSALDINEDIGQRGEQDAQMAILQGGYNASSLRQSGLLAASQGRSALAGSVLGAAGQAGMRAWRYQSDKPVSKEG